MERRVTREQVLAFRAAAQSLDRRRPATELLDVAGACGVQDTPPGSADVSLAARLDVEGPVVEEAVAAGDVHVLRTELLRRYLHCYAPTMPGHFAEWAGERGAARPGAGATR